jgi:hypothetical protein
MASSTFTPFEFLAQHVEEQHARRSNQADGFL